MKARLEQLKLEKLNTQDDLLSTIIEDDDLETDYLDEVDIDELLEEEAAKEVIDHKRVVEEIKELEGFIKQAQDIHNDEKAKALLTALDLGFTKMAEMGAARKVIIFTESKRTQSYLASFLSQNGYINKIVTFSGSNNHPEATEIYNKWKIKYQGSDKVTGSPQVDRRTALIDYFKDNAEIMIATEAAAEGVNLQFCSLLINYDLPWNPQRVEQRIGRCHRYGQKFDVVVINFLNKRNYADQRVLELLTDKFCLFDGVFGASDSVLGSLESGVDFEKRIQQIYEECRSPEEIESAFETLQKELEDDINTKMEQTKEALLEHFDEDIHDILKIKLDQAKERLDKVSRWFWSVTKFQLQNKASFDEQNYSFYLTQEVAGQKLGQYQLIRKIVSEGEDSRATISEHAHTYRITHPLGEYVVNSARELETPVAEICFDYENHGTKNSIAEQLKGQSGWLSLSLLRIEAFQTEEHLVFTALTDGGQQIDAEACKKLFNIAAAVGDTTETLHNDFFEQTKNRLIDAKLAEAMELNNQYFQDERDKLEKWADDKILAAEQALVDTKNQIKSVKRESRYAETIEEQKQLQKKLKELERKQRQQRADIWDVEDDIAEKRDELIAALEARMKQKTEISELFTIRWRVA